MPKFNAGDRVRVIPNSGNPLAYEYRARHGNIQSVREDAPADQETGVPQTIWYDVLLDSDLVNSREMVTLQEDTLEVGPR